MSNICKGDIIMEKYNPISEEERFHTPRMADVEVSYQSEDGQTTINHTIIRSRPSVAVIIINDDNYVALLKHFRTTTGSWYWEIPTGLIKEGENLREAAKREVEEKVGLVLKGIWQLSFGPNLLDPSKSDENYGIALAYFEGPTERHLEEQKVKENDIVWVPIEKVFERLKDQIGKGKPFKDNMFMSGHSVYAFLTYYFLEN